MVPIKEIDVHQVKELEDNDSATIVDILPSLRSADTPPVAYASEAPKVTLIAYIRSLDTNAAWTDKVFLTLAFVQSVVLIVKAIYL